uniref:Uncharacterized protein n=1 Tax=Anguilla anguilla TaxID=7936 RepID=A0A0E9SUR7_ANGAN
MATHLTFSSSKSVLLRKRMMETLLKTRLLTIVSKMLSDSMSRFVCRSSISTWSNSLDETRKRMEVTLSKHSNHRRRSDLCPPTSTILKGTFLISKSYSWMPLVGLRARRMSCCEGK